MKFDLAKIEYNEEVTDQLKKQYFDTVDEMVRTKTYDNKESRYITVFHGTNVNNLNSILLNGLLPRDTTGISNDENGLKSHKDLVYLTTIWHYFYAQRTCSTQENNNDNLNVPCYIECEIPLSECLFDEDFFHSNYIKEKIKNTLKSKKTIMDISCKECIDMYGTIAHIGTVSLNNIKSFTILGNGKKLYENFIDPRSKYMKQLTNWGNGKGIGTIKLKDLFYWEDDEYNITFWTKDIPKNHIITGIEPKENSNVKYSLVLNEIINKK